MLSKDEFDKINSDTVRSYRKQSLKNYFLNNWIAIVALIVAIVALFK